MLVKLERYFGKLPRVALYALSLGVLLLLAALDWYTRGHVSVIPFYWLPAFIVAVGDSLAGGIAISVLSAFTWFGVNYDYPFPMPSLLYWNVFGRAIFFSTVCLWVRSRRAERIQKEAVFLVNHEFSNALGSMYLTLGMLRDGEYPPIPETRRKGYELLERNIRHLGGATQNFLSLNRLETHLAGEEVTAPALKKMLQETAGLFEPLIVQKKLKLGLELPPKPMSVRADPEALALIVSNLVSNAIKYTLPGGSIKVKLAEGAGMAVISVEDTGIGIKVEDMPKDYNSGGLGLRLARSLIERQGSRLEVEGAPGKGSRFSFALPYFQ